MVAPAPPELAADLVAGLRRLKLATMRRLAPELALTAKTQRWSPEEFLRTLVEAEGRLPGPLRHRRPAQGRRLPVTRTIEGFDVAASSIPRATFDWV